MVDAGAVSVPVLGEIKVLGLTIGDLERLVTHVLRGRILVTPRVSVQIEEYRPFYVNGMVDKPGGYPYQPGLTVRKATSHSQARLDCAQGNFARRRFQGACLAEQDLHYS